MKVSDFAKTLLLGESIEDKLLSPKCIEWEELESWKPLRVKEPGRNELIAFSEEQIKFPGKGALREKKHRGKALHFFANHELLAIEMMAQALLLFPELTIGQRKLLISTIEDEQKHFSLYLKRMNDFGVKFGDFPLNQFFWSFMEKIESPEIFFAVISLTFEQANLDFALHYQNIFEEIGDDETARIMKEVYEDEIKHVARGKFELSSKLKNHEEDLWDYYCRLLPEPLTPARAKGIIFDRSARLKSGLSQSYIKELESYRNTFSITKRKQWKK